MNKKLEAAFKELDYEDDLLLQLEIKHLKQEIFELKKILYEHELQLRLRNQMLTRIHLAML